MQDFSKRFPGVKIHKSSYIHKKFFIGKNTKIWHFCHVLTNSNIGEDCSLGQNVVVGPNVNVGNKVKIQNNVSVYEGITIEDEVFCGPSSVFTNVINPRSNIERKDEFKKTIIRKGASIGANATIICGNNLGEYCFPIGKVEILTKEVPSFALMAGVPAKRIGWMSKAGAVLKSNLICPIDGSRYILTEKNKLELVEDE